MVQSAVEAVPHLKLSRSRRNAVTAGLMTGMTLAALEATVVSAAMPTVIAQLGGLHIYSWVFSIYLLTSTVTVPLWGKLSDIYGRRNFYLAGIVVFLIGSMLSGQAHSMGSLIVYRAIQGFGAGALVPIGLTIIGDIYTLKERARMQGFFSGVWGLAGILGPLVGGFITDHWSWRWVFYINLPMGIIAFAVISTALIEPREIHKRASIDYGGALALTASITILLFVLLQGGGSQSWLSTKTIGLVTLSVILLLVFIKIQFKVPEPLLPPDLFRNRIFTSASVLNLTAGMAFYGTISFVPLFVQGVIGTTATEAGSILTPLLLGWVTCSVIGSRVILRIGYRPVVLAGGLMFTIGSVALMRMGLATDQHIVLINMGLIGCGMGLTVTTMLLAVQNSVPKNRLGISTSTIMFFRSIGGAIGVAIMGAILNTRMTKDLAIFSQTNKEAAAKLGSFLQNPDAIVDPIARAAIPHEVLEPLRGALSHSLHGVFVIGLIVSILSFAAGLLVPAGRPHEHAHEATELHLD